MKKETHKMDKERIKKLYDSGKTIAEIESILGIKITIPDNLNENTAIISGEYNVKKILLG